MLVHFYTSGGDHIGGVRIRFYYRPLYLIYNCMSYWANSPVSLPTEVEKVWRITLNRNSGIRLLIHCNNVEVANFLMSYYSCDNYRSSYSNYWSRNVGKIRFDPNYDTASDFYRAGQPGTNA